MSVIKEEPVKYLMIHYLDETELNQADPDDAEDPAESAEILAWVTEMEARGVTLYGGELGPPRGAATVRVRDGEVLVTDGPFAETKEQVAGFNVIECGSLDEAVQIASRHPTARIGGFELRELMP